MMPKRFEQPLSIRASPVLHFPDSCFDYYRIEKLLREFSFLEPQMPNELPPVLGDAVHLQQVLLNLIVNGMDVLDETPQGERSVSVTALLGRPKTIYIAVSDSGRGIPTDKLTQIFDPFFTTKASGIGRGLSISRTIIEAHNGKLWAENRPQGGACFRFTLPVAKES
jgi:signal transduction histidine kinase